jgi:DNA-binding NtrC family response regulator
MHKATGEVLTLACLPESLRALGSGPPQPGTEADALDVGCLVDSLLQAGKEDIYRRVTAAVERVVFETVLRHVKGNQRQASELLGISRTTLRAKLRSLGMAIEKQLLSESERVHGPIA